MFKNHKPGKLISMILSFILILGSFSGYANAEGSPIKSSKVESAKAADKKIQPDVKSDMKTKELVDVMIYMEDQVDAEKVARATKSTLSSTETPHQIKLQVRRNIVEALNKKSETTQRNLLKFLEIEKAKGNVEDFTSYQIVNMLNVKATAEVIEKISQMSSVGKIYKNKTHQQETPLKATESSETPSELEWSVERVNAHKVWDLGYDGSGIVVANMDSGVDWTHPALKHKWRGYDPETEEIDPSESWFDASYGKELPVDSDLHGTHVMGTMVGQEPDGSNKIGVAPGAKWIAARVFDDFGATTDAILLSAADWMLAPGGNADAAPDVINNSWGGGDGIDDWFRDAVINWRAAGIVPIFAAGNQQDGEPAPWPGSINVPSNYPESIAVAATDAQNKLAFFSKLGPSPYDEDLIKPNLSAPGSDIRSAVPIGRGPNGSSYLPGMSGTSMAAPAVTGAVALLLSVDSSLSVDDIEGIITETADPLIDDKYPESPNMGYGYGLLDAFEAANSVIDGSGRIEGSVLGEGEDLEDAVINHNQTIFEVYYGADTNIEVQVSDDVAVKKVELLVKVEGATEWDIAEMKRISGNHKDGVYQGTITYDMLNGDKLTYKFRATDYIDDVVVSKDFLLDVKFGVIPGEYSQDFEGNTVGWSLNGDWRIGEPSGPSPRPFEGKKVLGTILDGDYYGNTISWALAPPIDLRDESLNYAAVKFQEWYSLEENFDFGYYYATNDYGENWEIVRPRVTEDSDGWQEGVLDLTKYIGSENPIFVTFRMYADHTNHRLGWYIDNFEVIDGDDESPEAPQDVTALASARGIDLSWSEVSAGDLAHYNIYRSTTSGEGYERLAESKIASYTDDAEEAGTVYYYVITAQDFFGNESEWSTEVSAEPSANEVIFSTDFENDNGGFISENIRGEGKLWEWGTPSELGPDSAASGKNVWATKLSDNYTNNTRAYIESPAIELPADKNGILSFNHWMEIEHNTVNFTPFDWGVVQVSKDNGDSWDTISKRYGERSRVWKGEELDLSAYRGETIKIRFDFQSDFSGYHAGWYIDDVYVLATDEEVTGNKTEEVELETLEDGSKDKVKESNLEDIKPDFKINHGTANANYDTVSDAVVQNTPLAGPRGILVDNAVVTILNTGRSIKAHPLTGEFDIRSSVGEVTLKAEGYGYYSEERVVTVEEEQVSIADFLLKPIPQGSIQGRVIDRYDGTPAGNALVRLVEDPNVKPVMTDDEGYFTFDKVYMGDYTLRVTADGFEQAEVEVKVEANKATDIEFKLARYVYVEDTIIYDDGLQEEGLAASAANDGFAVRFTPEEYGQVKGVDILVWDDSFPRPGGEILGFVIYDKNLQPVGDPIFQKLVRGDWNYIDLREFGYKTDQDFYISTIQNAPGHQSPAIAIDEDSPHSDRSFLNQGGEFTLLADVGIEGAVMMRAKMEYEMATPIITSPESETHTSDNTILVKGTSTTDGKINVYVNDENVKTVDTVNEAFSAEVNLPLHRNEIKVTGEVDGRETEPSDMVIVYNDNIEEELEPVDGIENMKPAADVTLRAGEQLEVSFRGPAGGTAHYRLVLPFGLAENNQGIPMTEGPDGFYSATWTAPEDLAATDVKVEFILETVEGETLRDFAKGTVTILRDDETQPGPAISIKNMKPATDVTLKEGETIQFSFEGPAGGTGHYSLMLPFDLADSKQGTPMTEGPNGFYSATWTAPEGLVISDLTVMFTLKTSDGQVLTNVADGKISVVGAMENLPTNSVIVDKKAFDVEFLNKNAEAQLELIEWSNLDNEVYYKVDSDTLVNIEGKEVDMNVLPAKLVYIDANGNARDYQK